MNSGCDTARYIVKYIAMKRMRAYKVELDPTNVQKTALIRHCGAARFVYNYALTEKKKAFDAREKIPRAFALAKRLRAERAEIAPWLSECASYAIDSTLPHCDKAFDNFFRRCKQKVKGKKGFPRFKSRKRGIGTIHFHNYYTVESKRVRLPKIGWIRLKECGYIPVTGTEGVKFYGASVSEKTGRWFLSVQVQVDVPEPKGYPNKPVIGVDFGIKTLAVSSDGREFANPKVLKINARKLARAQRSMSRKVEAAKRAQRELKDCRNYQKSKRRVAKIHARIGNVRANTLHNLSHRLTKNKSAVVIEDLNVAGMVRNRRLAKAISDCGFGELRRQIEYKAHWRGVDVLIAPRFFPSSKTCGVCGLVKDALRLSQRVWTCECGAKHDRDLNAANNLAALYEKGKVADIVAETLNACGEESSDLALPSSETIFYEAGTEQLLLF